MTSSLKQTPPYSPRVISFDCANTLLKVQWDPSRIATDSLAEAGYAFEEERAYGLYGSMVRAGWRQFREINLSRDLSLCDAWWDELGKAWVKELGLPPEAADKAGAIAWKHIYSRDEESFQLYEDVVPTLEALKAQGHRLIVISNWDVSLHRFLEVWGLTPFFEHVIASLEEGVEKPDPLLFQIAAERCGVQCEEMLHIGDDLVDDLQGARGAGFIGLHLDRGRSESQPPFLATLSDLLGWLG